MKMPVINRVLLFLGIIILILITFFSSRPLYSSTELEQVTMGDVTSYVDANGQIRMAGDKGYASVIKTCEDGKVVLEQYLDDQRRAVTLPAGYSQIQMVYDEEGMNTEIIYLDKFGNPTVISNGYDTIRRSYNENGKVDTDTYWADGVQVERKQGYWRYQRLYYTEGSDVGKICEIRYLDQSGELVNNSSGYAGILRSYDNDATIDMYYDQENEAAALSLGQYGKRTETVNDVQVTTYLGIDGKAENTNRGYAIVEKDGSKTLYYDRDHIPVTIGRNQYGIQKISGQSVYLDENGERMVRLDNVLNTSPLLVLLFGILAAAAALTVTGRGRVIFLVLYIAFTLFMTVAYRETGETRGAFELFWSYRKFFSSSMTRQNILNNIWLFVPLGAVLARFERKGLWIGAVALSVAIELVQLITGIGLFEFDDILSNSIGAGIGYGLASSLRKQIK